MKNIEKNNKVSKFLSYAQAYITTQGKKTITSIAQTVSQSRISVQRFFDKRSQKLEEIEAELIKQARKCFGLRPVTAVIDETKFQKIYAKQIEGLEYGFDSSNKRTCLLLNYIFVMLTDGAQNIPIKAKNVISKALAKDAYISKDQLVIMLLESLKKEFNITKFIGDAHYGSATVMQWCRENGIEALTKIPRNRKILVNKESGQIKNLVKLRRNEHSRRVGAILQGVKCYIYAVKLAPDKINYYISNYKIDRKKVFEIYKQRWIIEKFFRTAKQRLGLKDCQLLSAEKQMLHIYLVMQAYYDLEMLRVKENLSSVDVAVKHFLTLKSKCLPSGYA